MLAHLDQRPEPFEASVEDAALAKTAVEQLRNVASAKVRVSIVEQGSATVVVALPAPAVELLVRILGAMAEQKPFSLIPHDAYISTQDAADYLSVSRPYLCKLVDANKIRHTMAGRHRKIRFKDLLDYEKQSRKERQDALDAMAAEARELDLD